MINYELEKIRKEELSKTFPCRQRDQRENNQQKTSKADIFLRCVRFYTYRNKLLLLLSSSNRTNNPDFFKFSTSPVILNSLNPKPLDANDCFRFYFLQVLICLFLGTGRLTNWKMVSINQQKKSLQNLN